MAKIECAKLYSCCIDRFTHAVLFGNTTSHHQRHQRDSARVADSADIENIAVTVDARVMYHHLNDRPGPICAPDDWTRERLLTPSHLESYTASPRQIIDPTTPHHVPPQSTGHPLTHDFPSEIATTSPSLPLLDFALTGWSRNVCEDYSASSSPDVSVAPSSYIVVSKTRNSPGCVLSGYVFTIRGSLRLLIEPTCCRP